MKSHKKPKRLHSYLASNKQVMEMGSEGTLEPLMGTLPRGQGDMVPVPQGDTLLANRVRDLLLYDQAMTPKGLAGGEKLPAWCLDTARLLYAQKTMARAYVGTKKRRVGKAVQRDVTETLESVLKQTNSEVMTAAMVARLQTGGQIRCGTLPLNVRKLATTFSSQSLYSWDGVLELANWLKSLHELEQKENEDKPKGKDKPPPNPGDDPDDEDGEGEGEWTPDNKGDDGEDKDGICENFEAPERYSNAMSAWGRILNPEEPDKLSMRPRKAKGGRRRAQLEGAVPSKWHRMMLDRKVFGGRKKSGGSSKRGTILVDLSGSMSWTEKGIKRLLEVLPEATVIGYSGRYTGDDHVGRICTLVDRGRAALASDVISWIHGENPSSLCMGSNEIDGPCLEMIGHLPEPRIWISDGEVTGKGGFTTQLKALSLILQRKHKVTRAESADHAVAILKHGPYAKASQKI